MNARFLLALGFLSASASLAAKAQDPLAADPEHNRLLLENERVRVFETRLEPGAVSPMHSHPAFLAYSLSDAKIKFVPPDGAAREISVKPGIAVWNRPLTHAVENIGGTEFRLLHVELKENAAPSESSDAGARPLLLNPGGLKWVESPLLPNGARMAILEGDPSRPGPFTLRVKFAAGTEIPPHWHPSDEHATVLSGTLRMGLGNRFDKDKTTPVGACGFSLMPKGEPHFAWVKEATEIQVHGTGPWKVIYVDPKDDPAAPLHGGPSGSPGPK